MFMNFAEMGNHKLKLLKPLRFFLQYIVSFSLRLCIVRKTDKKKCMFGKRIKMSQNTQLNINNM